MRPPLSRLDNMRTTTTPRAIANLDATHQTLDDLVSLIATCRPDWDDGLIRAVLLGHLDHVPWPDLAIAALRAAKVDEFRSAKAIGWHGPHWDLAPSHLRPRERREGPKCRTCGKVESLCLSTRPRIVGPNVDDHEFDPPLGVAST